MSDIQLQPIQTEKNPWWIWVSIAIGVFMSTLDSSIVNISLPTIAHDLHSNIPSTQWVVLAYMVVLAGLLIPVGRLSDIVGRRKVYVFGMLFFSLGSLFCGTATSILMLIVMRGVQAVGAAGMLSNGPAITAEVFQTQRGRALGLTGSVVSVGTMAGPSIGGWIVQALGWPWIFLINVPIGIVSSVFAWRVLRNFDIPHHEKQPFDILGALLSIMGLFSLVILLTYGLGIAWWHPLNLSLACVSLVSLGAFLIRQLKTPFPLIDLRLFKERLLTNTCVASFFSFVGITFIFFLTPFYFELIRHFTPSISGWLLLTTSFALLLFSPLSGHLSDKVGSRNLSIAGMLVSATGLFLISRFETGTPIPQIILSLFLVGMGNGLFNAPNNSQMLGAVHPRFLGLMGGVLAIVRTLGMMTAVALAGFVYIRFNAGLTQPGGFIPAFHTVFRIGTALTVLNALWIALYRAKISVVAGTKP